MIESTTEPILTVGPINQANVTYLISRVADVIATCVNAVDRKLSTAPFSFQAYYIHDNSIVSEPNKTNSLELLKTKVRGFFVYICNRINMGYEELVLSCKYVERYIAAHIRLRTKEENDTESKTKFYDKLEPSLGTVLLCALLISQKYTRDVPYHNSYFATELHISIQCVTNSEYCFGSMIGWRFYVSANKFIQMENFLFGRSYCTVSSA